MWRRATVEKSKSDFIYNVVREITERKNNNIVTIDYRRYLSANYVVLLLFMLLVLLLLLV